MWIGVTLAFFHSSGNVPVFKDSLKINVSGINIAEAVSLSSLLLIPSGPLAFCTLSDLKTDMTSSLDIFSDSNLEEVLNLSFGAPGEQEASIGF